MKTAAALACLLLAAPAFAQSNVNSGGTKVVGVPQGTPAGAANLPTSATYGIKTDAQGVATPITVRPYDATNPPPATVFDNSSTAVVTSPQPGHATITVPTLSATSPGVLTSLALGAAPTLSMLGSTGNLGDAFGAYTTSQSLKATNVNLFRNLTYTGTGWSYGSGATFTNFQNQPWAVDQPNQWNVNFNRRSISQMFGSTDSKNAVGDDAFIYAYLLSVGGSTAAADEGQTFVHGQTGELKNYPQGVVASSSATGLSSLSITPTPFNAAGTQQFCDGCMLVQKTGGVTGHYTGTPTRVFGATQTLYYTQPVDITVTPSVYGALLGCPAAGGGPLPQSSSPMVYRDDTCTLSAAHGTFPVGPITIEGQNTEQASITSVSAVVGSGSSATQSVTIHHKDMNGVGNTTVWSGGPQGMINMAAWPESKLYLASGTVGMPIGNVIYGATDAHTLAMGNAHLGAPDAPTTFFNTLGVFNLSQSGTAVTAFASDPFNRTFNHIAGAVVSGCGNALDGTIVGAIAENLSDSSLAWTSSVSAFVTCPSATLSLPPAMTAFTNYPYAEQIVGDSALPVYYQPGDPDPTHQAGALNPQATGAALAATRIFTLELNHVPWQNGAQVFEVHPNAQDGNSIWIDHGNANPSSINQQTDLFLSGTGVATGLGAWAQIYNESPYDWYAGAGGLVKPKPFLDFYGPNSSSEITLPLNGDPLVKYDCPTPDPTCQNPQKMWDINGHTVAIWNDSTQTFIFPGGRVQVSQVNGVNISTSAGAGNFLAGDGMYKAPPGGSSISPGTYFTAGGGGTQGGPTVGTLNHVICGGIVIPLGGLSVGHIAFSVSTGDGGSATDVGIYTGTGTLAAHTGSQSFSYGAAYTAAFAGGTQTIPAGKAYVCYTSTNTSFNLNVANQSPTFYQIADVGAVGSSGTLSSSIIVPADNPSASAYNTSFPPIVLYP